MTAVKTAHISHDSEAQSSFSVRAGSLEGSAVYLFACIALLCIVAARPFNLRADVYISTGIKIRYRIRRMRRRRREKLRISPRDAAHHEGEPAGKGAGMRHEGPHRQVWTKAEQQLFFAKVVEIESFHNLRQLFQHMEQV